MITFLLFITSVIFVTYSLDSWEGYTRDTFNAIVSAYDFANTYSVAFKAGIQAGARGRKNFPT